MPDSLPRARTRSPSLAGGAPPRSTPSRSPRIRALSTRLRGWSREGKNDPVRSSGMAGFDLPGGGGHRLEALAVAPVGALRRARRGAARRSRQRPRTPTGPVRPGPEQAAEDARLARSGSARTSRISVDTAHWLVAGIAGALLVNPGRGTGLPRCPPPSRAGGPLDAEDPAGITTTLRDAPAAIVRSGVRRGSGDRCR